MAQPPGSGGVVAFYNMQQQGEAVAGNLLVSNGDGFAQDAGISSTAPSFQTLTLTGLPTADPHVVGALWNNAGVINISAG